ncbi:MAG: hypothetical protein J5515_03470 [Lachnospiraceae bacterium]|nr:hypothetical protein [Lachnospiraceae bacterium]
MKKKYILSLILTTVLTLTACTNPFNASVVTSDKDDDSNSHAVIVSSVDVTAMDPVSSDSGKDNTVNTTDTDPSGADTSALDDSWKQIYVDFIENDMDDILGDYDLDWFTNWSFGFIYVNDDTIPELVISAGYEAGGNVILTIANGHVDYIITSRLGFYYDEKGDYLVNSDGHMGYYFDDVYTIDEDGFVFLKAGVYNDVYDEDYNYTGEMEYFLDDEEVSEEEYRETIDSYIPMTERIYWNSGSTSDSIMDYLKGNVYKNYYDAYKAVVKEYLDNEYAHFALVESDSYAPFLLLDINDWVYIYYFQDGMAFRGADFYGSYNKNFLYTDTGVVCTYSEYSDNVSLFYSIYTSSMGSTYFSYASRNGMYDDNGEFVKDKDGNVLLQYTINSEVVSEMEYAEFMEQYDSDDCVVLYCASANEEEDYVYSTPDEMYAFLNKR